MTGHFYHVGCCHSLRAPLSTAGTALPVPGLGGAARGPDPSQPRTPSPSCGPYHTGRVCGFLGDVDQVTLLVCSGLAIQNVLLHHLEIPVFAWNVSVLQGDEDWICVLPLKPLLCLQRGFGPRCVRIQVILEEVRLQETFWGNP